MEISYLQFGFYFPNNHEVLLFLTDLGKIRRLKLSKADSLRLLSWLRDISDEKPMKPLTLKVEGGRLDFTCEKFKEDEMSQWKLIVKSTIDKRPEEDMEVPFNSGNHEGMILVLCLSLLEISPENILPKLEELMVG